MRDPIFTALCALAIVLLLLPLPWHLKARNTGTLLYVGWTILGNIVFLVNSIVWSGNLNNPAPVWCDISTKIIIGLSVGVCAASLSINRRLYLIAVRRKSSNFETFTRRDTYFDLGLGIGLPALVMALHYIVQAHRYDIIEDIGCWPVVYNTLLSIPVVLMWPILIGIPSSMYAALAILAFLRGRPQFSAALANSRTGLNVHRYFRLMALAATTILFTVPLALILVVSNLQYPQTPWISWEYTHYNFRRVDYYHYSYLEAFPNVMLALNINRWATPCGAFIFFAYFGLTGEAAAEYKRIFWLAAGLAGCKRPASVPRQSNGANGFGPSNLADGGEITTFSSARPMLDPDQSCTTISNSAFQPDADELTQQELDDVEVKPRDLESQIVL